MNLPDRWCTAGKEDLLGLSLSSHVDDLSAGCTTDNTVVDKKDISVLELLLHGIQLSPHRLLALLLAGHDESPSNITVLDKGLTVRNAELLSQAECRHLGGAGNRDDEIDGLHNVFAQLLQHGIGEGQSHVLSRPINRDSIHHGVGTGKVDKLEDIGRVVQRRYDLAEIGLAALGDDDSLAGLDVDVVRVLQLVKSDTFAGEHVVHSASRSVRLSRSQDQRPDPMGVAESDDSKT
jgi:hypothetical protein